MTDWTNPRTWVIGEKVTKAIMDTHIRDNLNHLKEQTTYGGSVLNLSPESAIFPISGITGAGLQQYESTATSPKINEFRLSFVHTADTWAMWKRAVSGAIGSNPYMKVHGYMATATSGNLGLGVRLAAKSSGDASIPAKAFASSQTVDIVVPASAGTKFTIDFNMTSLDSLTVFDEINIGLYRNTAVSGNATGICYITYVQFFYGV